MKRVNIFVVLVLLFLAFKINAEEKTSSGVWSLFTQMGQEVYQGAWSQSVAGSWGFRSKREEFVPSGQMVFWKSKHDIIEFGPEVSGPENPTNAEDWADCDAGPNVNIMVGKGIDLLTNQPSLFSQLRVSISWEIRYKEWCFFVPIYYKPL